ncbi:acetyltransferase [Elioraea thermophila]|uniref:acetyltransferase n=1 Tax=Elioraea thermophila TaxID=2185104 RepID=UPI000DF2C0FC|nr:acetyltransferase [Elioraea thermophila]
MSLRERRIVILGAGGHGRGVADIFTLSGWRVDGFLADAKDGLVAGLPVLGPLARAFEAGFLDGRAAIVALGDNGKRALISRALLDRGVALATAIQPSAVVAGDAVIGAATMVGAGAILGVGARVGRFCIVNTAASVDHDCVLEEGAFVAPGVRLCGGVRLGEGAFVGAGAVILPGVTVGAGTRIPAGSVVSGSRF